MKVISTAVSALFLLLGSAVAQAQPFEFSEVSPYTWQGKNIASKEILAYVIEFESPRVTIVAHDYYFKPEGIAPGAIEVFDQVKASEPGHVLWVQFVDGTEGGTTRSVSPMYCSIASPHYIGYHKWSTPTTTAGKGNSRPIWTLTKE